MQYTFNLDDSCKSDGVGTPFTFWHKGGTDGPVCDLFEDVKSDSDRYELLGSDTSYS